MAKKTQHDKGSFKKPIMLQTWPYILILLLSISAEMASLYVADIDHLIEDYKKQSSKSFLAIVFEHEHSAVLIADIIVNFALIAFLLLLYKSNNKAVNLATSKTNELKKSESTMEAYIDASGDGYWDWYVQEDYEYMSPRFWKMFGYKPDEKLHKPSEWQDIIFEEDLESALRNYEKHVKTKGKYAFEQEVRYRHKLGHTVHVLCKGSVIEWDEDGQPIRMVGTHTDITSLKKAESSLQEQTKYLEMAEKVAGVGHWNLDLDAEEVFWSDGIYTIHGVTKEEYTPELQSAIEFYHPDDRQKVKDYIEGAISNKDGFEFELRLQMKDGKIKHVYSKGNCQLDKNGEVRSIFGTFQDITETIKSQKDTEDSRQFLELITENNPSPILVKDRDFRIVEANKAFLSLYPEEKQGDIIGHTTIEEYDEKDAERFLATDRKAFREGYSETFETITFPDGKTRTLFTQKVRFENARGEDFILGIARDVTERENLVEKLTKSNEELERFAFVASHDLQEPLRIVVNFNNLLADRYKDQLDDEGKQYIDFSISAATRMQALIVDLLEYARIGEESDKKEEIDLNKTLEYVLENLHESIEQSGAEIKYKKLPKITGSPVKYARLLQNLIGNSLKYRKDGTKPKIVISCKKLSTEFLFSIKDNGIGIKKEYHEQIFEPFKRLHSGNKYSGTGMGLAISKKIVENTGGRIWAETNDDGGCIFNFTVSKEK